MNVSGFAAGSFATSLLVNPDSLHANENTKDSSNKCGGKVFCLGFMICSIVFSSSRETSLGCETALWVDVQLVYQMMILGVLWAVFSLKGGYIEYIANKFSLVE